MKYFWLNAANHDIVVAFENQNLRLNNINSIILIRFKKVCRSFIFVFGIVSLSLGRFLATVKSYLRIKLFRYVKPSISDFLRVLICASLLYYDS